MNQPFHLRPFTYIVGGRFTNRKHRIIDSAVLIMSDSDFILHSLSGYGDRLVDGRFTIDIRDADNYECITRMKVNSLPQPIAPSIPFPAGGFLPFTATLEEGLMIGRSRPFFQIYCYGFKVFRDPIEDRRRRLEELQKLGTPASPESLPRPN